MFSSSVPGSSSPSAISNTSCAPDRKVNHLLHTLRGEHFRRGLNADRVRLARAVSSGGPTLPPLVSAFPAPHRPSPSFLPSAKPAPGPPAPRSWAHTHTPRQQQQDALDGAAWRASAFELCFAPPARDSLVQMCLEIILAEDVDVVLEILPELPVHLRRQVMLHTAVHAPLSADGVRALLARQPAGGVGGELVLARSYGAQFLQRAGVLGAPALSVAAPTREWDDEQDGMHNDDADESTALHTLVLLSAPLAPPLLSLLPATLTRLALLALPAPLAGLHRLPALLPLLAVVDLSFNPWMLDPVAHEGDDSTTRAIDRVQWHRWRQLQVLGLRQCGFDATSARELEDTVQKGRILDVVVYT